MLATWSAASHEKLVLSLDLANKGAQRVWHPNNTPDTTQVLTTAPGNKKTQRMLLARVYCAPICRAHQNVRLKAWTLDPESL